MPNIELNHFFEWIQQDDIISSSWGIVEAEGLDWLRTWYGITLWAKPQKQILTSTTAMRVIASRSSIWSISTAYAAWDGWNIYRLNWVDNTPTYTTPSTNDIYNWLFYTNRWEYFFIAETTTNNYSLASVSASADADVWTSLNESVKTNMINSTVPPMLVNGVFLYIGYWTTVLRIDSAWTQVTQSIFSADVTWITRHWTQFYVYSTNGSLSIWDWVSASVSALIELKHRIRRVIQEAWIDYITTETGELRQLNWYTLWEPVTEPRKSRRLSDNSQYISKLNFSTTSDDTHTLEFAWDNLILIGNDTQPWVYKFWNLIPGLPKSFHKIITQDNTNTNLDYIHTLEYSEPIDTLYYSYQRGAQYWIDKIVWSELTTAQDWYFVTQIFRWPPNKVNKITQVRATTSYTSWDNYIKIYKRINNGAWVLIRTVNDATDTIDRHEIGTNADGTNLSDVFIDIQFKIEIHNDLQTDTPPILHNFELIYSLNWD